MKINKTNKIIKLAKVTLLSSVVFAPLVNAAVVFEDQFDQVEITSVMPQDTTGTATWLRSRASSNYDTGASIGNGVLSVKTTDSPYGGVISQKLSELDFFANEITITYRGLDLQASSTTEGEGSLADQGVVFGIGNTRLGRNSNSWHPYSNFTANYFGSGRFQFGIYNYAYTLTPAPIQQIPAPYLNYGISALTAVKVTLDDTYYRLLFEFGNPLNSLSFAGPHYLAKDLWNVSFLMRDLANAKTTAEKNLATAVASNDDVAIAQATTALDTALAKYNAQYVTAGEELTAGYSFIFFGAVSADRRGAVATVDSITVETTNILQVLRP